MQALRAFWKAGHAGVLALVGLGGAGKTAVAAQFLEELLSPDFAPRPDGILVWSFYVEPDPTRFLQEAYRYFARPDSPALSAKGSGLFHLLRDALSAGGRYFLFLDGLEKVQRQESSSAGSYGQVEDPLLKSLLTRLAEGMGNTTALVTSRFVLTDLERFSGQGYRQVEIGGLAIPAALELLRRRGVNGDDATLARLVDEYGAHALTLDHLGGLLAQFFGGDPSRAPQVGALADVTTDRQALRLARLLRAYEEHLPPAELKLLCQLCLLRRGMTEEQMQQLFLCSPPVHARMVRELKESILQVTAKRDLAEAICDYLQEALCTAPIAGPEEIFRSEIISAAARTVESHERDTDPEFEELIRLYSDKSLDAPTERRPLSAGDRENLDVLYRRYLELRSHPLMPYQDPSATLQKAFQEVGFSKLYRAEDEIVTPPDVLHSFRNCQERLRYLTFKHFALCRVLELCRLYQHKWILAGPLATLDRGELREVLSSLVDRHLLLKEGQDTYSAHPAVRDHFSRLASVVEPESWHDLIREQLISLSERPGSGFAEHPATLDFVEEAIYHAQQAGKNQDAVGLYNHVLGGVRQLGWKLGEMSRGLRILRGFNPCPEAWDLAWYLRALGELEEAYQQLPLCYFRGDVRLLQGRLPEAAAVEDEPRKAVADFLMGLTREVPPDVLGYAIPRAQVFLYLGQLEQARRAARLGDVYQEIAWAGEKARSTLFLAEIARRQADLDACREHLDAASGWILHSASVEHLCLLHLMRSRLARNAGDLEMAQRTIDEGLHIARQCGLGLYHIELLCEQAELFLGRAEFQAAETPGREALRHARDEECQFVWGAGVAGHLVGKALVSQERFREARAMLGETLALRISIGDPGAATTQQLLEKIP
jgi:hypothetical protein